MENSIKLFVILFLISTVFIFPSYGQIILSVGGNSYLGNTGLIFGGGIAFEYWLGFSETRSSSGLNLGFGAEYISVTTEFTQTKGSGWVFPFTLKYGSLVSKRLNFGLGVGAAIVTMEVDVLDYYDDYYISTESGVAPLAELCLTYLTPPQILIILALRGGALFIGDGIYPFIGAKLHLGYYIFIPE